MRHDIEALLAAHDRVCREIGRAEVNETDEYSAGHTNGVKEARNRVEEVIHNHIDSDHSVYVNGEELGELLDDLQQCKRGE